MTDKDESGPLTVADAAARFESLMTPAGEQENTDPEREEEAPELTEEESAEQDGPDDEELEEGKEEEGEEEVVAEEAKQSAPIELEITLPDGEKLKLTPDEIAKGYLRQSDYTKKQQEIAETRKLHENIVQQYEQRMTQALSQLEQKLIHDANVANLTPQEWADLKQSDPAAYLLKRDEMQSRMAEIQQVQQQNALRQHQQTEQQRAEALKKLEEQEILLAKRIPAWSDSQARSTLQTQISEYLHESGFKPEEIGNLADARLVETAYKAMQWDKLQKSKPLVTKKIAEAPKVARTAAGTDSAARNRLTREGTLKQLKKTGSVQDAAKAILARM